MEGRSRFWTGLLVVALALIGCAAVQTGYRVVSAVCMFAVVMISLVRTRL